MKIQCHKNENQNIRMEEHQQIYVSENGESFYTLCLTYSDRHSGYVRYADRAFDWWFPVSSACHFSSRILPRKSTEDDFPWPEAPLRTYSSNSSNRARMPQINKTTRFSFLHCSIHQFIAIVKRRNAFAPSKPCISPCADLYDVPRIRFLQVTISSTEQGCVIEVIGSWSEGIKPMSLWIGHVPHSFLKIQPHEAISWPSQTQRTHTVKSRWISSP